MKFLLSLALTTYLFGVQVVAQTPDCRPWCSEIPIPAKVSNGGPQHCDFLGFCDACDACTTTPTKFITACGSSKGNCKDDPTKAEEKDTEHEVRCCSDDFISGWVKKSPACPYGSSLQQCVHGATHDDAIAACANAGARLCTTAEMKDDCTKGTGCNHDNDRIWTSDAATADNVKYINCGRKGFCNGIEEKEASPQETHEVRCCSDTFKQGWKKNTNCVVWGESDLPTCFHEETYDSAVEICDNNGARLCTSEELEDNCTAGSGCGHDADFVWSSKTFTATADNVKYINCGRKGFCNGIEEKEASPQETHEVRCCSDTFKQGWKKNTNCVVWGESDLPTCFHEETYDSAVEICDNNGARLCTSEELQDNCTAGSGCGHDADFVWSSKTSTV